jgi:hypothetical protein
MGLGGQNGTDSLFLLRDQSMLSMRQVKPEVSDSILANLGFLLENLISCLSQKEEKEESSFHTIFLSWSSQQKVIYILEESAAMLVGQESL